MESRPTLWYRLVRWGMRHLVFAPTGGVEARGLENIPAEGPVIFAPVHMSHADPPLIGGLVQRRLRVMAKEELFRFPMGAFIRSIGVFPVKRGEVDKAAIKFSLDVLRDGQCLLLFPEGARGDGVTMNPIQPGIALLAEKTGAKVVPVGISGTAVVMPKGGGRPKRARCRVVFAPPIQFGDQTAKEGQSERQAFADLLAQRIALATNEAGWPIKVSESNLG